jgi:hypothetical protein
VAVVTVAVIAALLGWFYQREQTEYSRARFQTIPAPYTTLFENVLKARQQGDFEGAARMALDSVRGDSSDDVLYRMASDSYFERAQTEPSRREELVKLGVQYSERAFAANPTDLIDAYDVAESYETAGMKFDGATSCDYFKKAEEHFEVLLMKQVFKQHSAVIGGEEVNVRPFRSKGNDKLKEVRQLIATHCPASH